MSGIRHRFLSDTAIQVFAIIMMIFERVQGAVERYSSAAVPGIACIATACTRGAQCTGDVTEPGPRAFWVAQRPPDDRGTPSPMLSLLSATRRKRGAEGPVLTPKPPRQDLPLDRLWSRS